MAKMSIIVAVYNTDLLFLDKCVESIRNQTLKDIEIILIDDGSKKDCAKRCDYYAQEDSRIRVIHKRNEGVSTASNLGIQEARGEYLTFVDHDDFIDTNMCERTLDKIMELKVDALAFGYYSYTTKKTIRGYYKGPKEYVFDRQKIPMFLAQIIHVKACKEIEIGFAGANWGIVYNTSKLKKTRAEFPVGMQGGEDAVFTYRAVKEFEKIAYLNENFYYYRQNRLSFTKRYREDAVESQCKHIDMLYDLIEKESHYELKAWRMLCCDSMFSLGEYLFRLENDIPYTKKREHFVRLISRWEFQQALKEICSYNFSFKKKVILSLLKIRMIDLFLFVCYLLFRKESKEIYD